MSCLSCENTKERNTVDSLYSSAYSTLLGERAFQRICLIEVNVIKESYLSYFVSRMLAVY